MKRRKRNAPRWAGLALLLVAALVVTLSLSPRHRAFYLQIFSGSSQDHSRPPEAPRTLSSQSSSGSGAQLPSGPAPGKPAPALQPVREDQVVVKIADEDPGKLPQTSPPPGWDLKEFSGQAQVEVVKDGARLALRLVSKQTSFALYRDVLLDPKRFPVLTWSWKALALPAGGDVRERGRDDQAIQVYVIFPRWPSPKVNSDVIGYIWDSRAPAGLKITSPQSRNVRLVVLQSGGENAGRWIREERNVYQDYVELFKREPPKVGKIAVMIDSNDTRSSAESYIHDLAFLRAN